MDRFSTLLFRFTIRFLIKYIFKFKLTFFLVESYPNVFDKKKSFPNVSTCRILSVNNLFFFC